MCPEDVQEVTQQLLCEQVWCSFDHLELEVGCSFKGKGKFWDRQAKYLRCSLKLNLTANQNTHFSLTASRTVFSLPSEVLRSPPPPRHPISVMLLCASEAM